MLRIGAGLFSLFGGVVIIIIDARYGYRTADNEVDGYTVGFLFGMIAAGGLFGHAVAVKLWSHGKRLAAIFLFLAATSAVVISLSNSLGAMAGRGDQTQAKRLQVAASARATNRSLDLAQKKLESLTFTPTNEETVKAFKVASEAATAAKDAECKFVRGKKCEARVADEQKALAALTEASKNKALTDSAAALDLEIAGYKKILDQTGAVLESNSQGSALARLFNLPDSTASLMSTWQNFLTGAIVNVLIAAAMVAYEGLSPEHNRKAAVPEPRGRREDAVALVPVDGRAPEKPIAFPEAQKPRLIASRANPLGNVPTITAELLEAGRGKVEIEDAFKAYALVCRDQGKRPVSPEMFAADIKKLCLTSGIRIEAKGDRFYLMKVRLREIEATVGRN
jgi:hypothetical protein